MDSSAYFFQQLTNGVSLGVIYALIALGYTMVYGVLRFINFAHGDVFMVGAFVAYYLSRWITPAMEGAHYLLKGTIVLCGCMICCAVLGVVIEYLAYRPLRSRQRLVVLITAIGVSLLLEYTAQLLFGATPKSFPELIPHQEWVNFGGVIITNKQVIVLAITVVLLVALRFFVMKTRVGLAMRALSLNPTAAALMGVNNNAVVALTFAVGSGLAAAAGVFFGILYPKIDPFMGVLPGIKAFVAAVLGGIGNIPGAALGGVLIGVVEALVVGYSSVLGFSAGYRDAVAFVILILILLFRPSGLLGKVEREKV